MNLRDLKLYSCLRIGGLSLGMGVLSLGMGAGLLRARLSSSASRGLRFTPLTAGKLDAPIWSIITVVPVALVVHQRPDPDRHLGLHLQRLRLEHRRAGRFCILGLE